MSLVEKEKDTGEPVPWIPLIVLSASLGFIGAVWIGFLQPNPFAGEAYNLGVVVCATIVTPISFITISAVKFLSTLTKRKISVTTLTYLYTVTIVSAYYMSTYYPFALPARFFTLRFINPDDAKYIPSLMAPSAAVTEKLMTGGVPIPWEEWTLPILYWWGSSVLFGLFFISISNILRARWINIEKVPFPHTVLAYNIIIGTTKGSKLEARRIVSPYILGLVVGFIYQTLVFTALLFPWFPDVFGWRTQTCPGGWYYLTPDSPLAGIIGFSNFNKNPLLISVAYLAPKTVLFSTVFWYIVFLILMQVAYTSGYYTSIPSLSGCGRIWCGSDTIPFGEPYKWVLISNIGGVLSLVIFYMFTIRTYIMDTIRAALGKGPMLETERNEPMTYRNSYLMLFASFLLILAILHMSGVNLAAAFALIFIACIWFLAGIRIYGLIGFDARSGGLGMAMMKILYPPPAENPDRSWILSMYFAGTQASDAPQYGWGGTLFASMAAYRLANLTGVNNRNVFKLICITAILAPISAILGFLTIMYTFGQSKLHAPNVIQDTIQNYSWRAFSPNYPTTPPHIPYILVGMAIVGFLTIMHARYVWFPLEPIGFLTATTSHTLLEGAWTMFTAAWILKELTLRIGGSKAYENYGVPTASGFFLGYVLAILLAGVVSLTRFFFPF
jgi:hypothetical protein